MCICFSSLARRRTVAPPRRLESAGQADPTQTFAKLEALKLAAKANPASSSTAILS